jgi:hypothetical protein
MNKFFEIVNLAVPCSFILNDGSRADLRLGIPKNAPELYKDGFAYLGLKPGAEKLFKKELDSTVIELIRKAKRIEDVEILALVKPDNTNVQEEVKKKLAEFK